MKSNNNYCIAITLTLFFKTKKNNLNALKYLGKKTLGLNIIRTNQPK